MKVTFSGTHSQVVRKGGAYVIEGYRVTDTKESINWPFFWQKRYTVTMVKYASEPLVLAFKTETRYDPSTGEFFVDLQYWLCSRD